MEDNFIHVIIGDGHRIVIAMDLRGEVIVIDGVSESVASHVLAMSYGHRHKVNRVCHGGDVLFLMTDVCNHKVKTALPPLISMVGDRGEYELCCDLGEALYDLRPSGDIGMCQGC